MKHFRHILRKSIITLFLFSILMLSGCSAIKMNAGFLHFCGAISEEEYQNYIQLIDSNQLDEKGNYVIPEVSSVPEFVPPEGSVHVTFAKSAYIDVQYYLDSDLTTPVDTAKCYLLPNDCIYTAEPICDHPSSNRYQFDRFCIYAYDEDGKRTQELFWDNPDNSPYALRIPENCEYSEVSIIPVGKYEERTLELTDYYIDSAGNQQELSGTWIVNDEEVSTQRIEVSSVELLCVDFKYDDKKYDYVSSEPSCFYHEKGLVRFETTYANEDIDQYSVKLRPLKGVFSFDPSRYPVEHGSVTFQYNGSIIRDTIDIYDGEHINYTAIPDNGYLTSAETGQISVNTSNPDETDNAIRDAVTFYPDEQVSVVLPRPEIGGTVEYTNMSTGQVLIGTTTILPCATKIGIKFTPWSGWKCKTASGSYTVKGQKTGQTASIDGVNIKLNAFEEDDIHKPILNIVLTDSMKTASLDILTSDNSKSGLNYEAGSKTSIIPDLLGKTDREIFGGGKIGTGKGIKLIVNNIASFNGFAIKLEITKKDTKGKESKEIRYITSAPIEEQIDLYSKDQIAISSTIYESVTIKISRIEVSSYMTRIISNASITARITGEDHLLQDGDVLEPSREVEITFTPDSGYYIVGSKRGDGVYSETMKYSKWEKDSSKIREKHPAKKIWYVTLDTADSYGTCIYKLDNATISNTSTVGIREGQKLTLEYTLTDPDYQIARSGVGGFIGGTFHDKTESVSISLSKALDGQTIRRSDYIAVERKEG